jgi:transglutaminase superfamily protein
MATEPDHHVPTTTERVAIAARAVWLFAVIRARLHRRELRDVVSSLNAVERARAARARPIRLGTIVARALSIGPWEARCLHTSLVLYRLLREQGERPELVIGLKERPREKDAHAWVELDGRDVGPPPGRGRHRELARYPS